MTQHEYLFVAVSIILGLAITRLLHTVAMLIRTRSAVTFHWASASWAFCILAYALQLWWIGWGLRDISDWSFSDFLVLVAGSVCVYGAAEMALPVPGEGDLDLLNHSQTVGRLAALSMLLYFLVGIYFNMVMVNTPIVAALAVPSLGILAMLIQISRPSSFSAVTVFFVIYTAVILVLTA